MKRLASLLLINGLVPTYGGSVLCIIGTFFDMSTSNCGFGHFAEF